MTSPARPRSAAEIRAMLTERLNEALLRPSMFGGEMTLQFTLDDLAWIDGRDAELGSVTQVLNSGSWSGLWSSIGVRGPFCHLFGGEPYQHDAAMAQVYADVAHAWGYLTPDRVLTDDEYATLRREARPWTAARDRSLDDLLGAFGPPSTGRHTRFNPTWPLSVGYVSGRPADPLVAFDFWTDYHWHPADQPGVGPPPVLRDVRWRTGGEDYPGFVAGFTLTPTGQTLVLPDEDDNDE